MERPGADDRGGGGFPFTELVVPGRDVALQLLLQRRSDGLGVVLVLPFRITGTNADGSQQVQALEPLALARGESAVSEGTDFSIELRQFSDFTLLIAKKDPGQGLVWIAFGFLSSASRCRSGCRAGASGRGSIPRASSP